MICSIYYCVYYYNCFLYDLMCFNYYFIIMIIEIQIHDYYAYLYVFYVHYAYSVFSCETTQKKTWENKTGPRIHIKHISEHRDMYFKNKSQENHIII